jgi:RNA recognition motif-containing protein
VESVKVMRDPSTGVSRGFGFVCFLYPQSAAAAIGCMQGFELYGQRVTVRSAKESPRFKRIARPAPVLMPAWQPVYEEPIIFEHPMATNKAFLQVTLAVSLISLCRMDERTDL